MSSTPAIPPPALPQPLRPRPFLAAAMLCWREIIRFLRQRNRVIGSLGQPLLFWILFGAGLDRSFRLSPAGSSGQSFLEYFFPGTVVLILLFTAIFATISIIEDRREGFLQSVLVAPIPRWSMVLGKVSGGALIAFFQGLLFLLLTLMLPISLGPWALLGVVAMLLAVSLGLTSLGLVIAWPMDSTQGFHAIMNLLLMPMWLLSGAFFPVPALSAGASWGAWGLHWIMRINPLTYAVAGLRHLMYLGTGPILPSSEIGSADVFWMPRLATCWAVTLVFTALAFGAAWKISAQRTTGDLL